MDAVQLSVDTRARFVWRRGVDRSLAVPCGVVVQHGDCPHLYVRWAWSADDPHSHRDGELWQLESLRPLTVSPAVRCEGCGRDWRIAEGRWQPL